MCTKSWRSEHFCPSLQSWRKMQIVPLVELNPWRKAVNLLRLRNLKVWLKLWMTEGSVQRLRTRFVWGRFGVSHTESWNCRDHHYQRSLQHDGKAPARRNRCYVANNLKFVFFTAIMSDSALDAKSGCELVLGRSAQLKRCLFPSSFQVSGFWHLGICN